MGKTTTLTCGLYAFWAYEGSPPYFLGGRVTKLHSDGCVETVEYGPRQKFKPCLIVPEATGQAIQAELLEIEATHREQIRKVERESAAALIKKVPALADHLPKSVFAP